MNPARLLFVAMTAAVPALIGAQGLGTGGVDPVSIRQPLRATWPTYSGDYTGRRYSALTQVTPLTVNNLTLAWVTRVTAGSIMAAAAPVPAFGPRMIAGGEGTGEF